MKRYFLPNNQNGDNQSQLKNAIDIASEMCKNDSLIKSCVLLVPTQNNVSHLEKLFGKDFFENIRKGKGVSLFNKGPGIQILTDKTIQNCSQSETVIIATYVRYSTLVKLDNLQNCRAVIAIPWVKDELNLWVGTWNPTIIDENGIVVEKTNNLIKITNSIVKNAIDEFSNKSISHNSDKENFVTKFKIFKRNNIDYDTKEILAYLVREKGWTTENAQSVKELGDKIREGKRIKGGDFTNEKETIERWKE